MVSALPTNEREEAIYTDLELLVEEADRRLKDKSRYSGIDFESWVNETLERKPTEAEVDGFVRALVGREKKASMMGAGKSIIVDGVARPRENADGRPIYPTEAGVRNFWRWINDLRQRRLVQAAQTDQDQTGHGQAAGRTPRSGSGDRSVFDLEGRPKVLYHGTRSNIEAFDLNHPDKRDNGRLGKEVYLSNDPDMANFYAAQKGGSSNLMPVYVALSNPYRFTVEQKRKLSRASKDVVDSFTKEAIAKGYDGGILDHGNDTFEVVVFDPSAVKSATGNNGEFSAKDTRVSRSEQNARTDGNQLAEEEIVATVTATMACDDNVLGCLCLPRRRPAQARKPLPLFSFPTPSSDTAIYPNFVS